MSGPGSGDASTAITEKSCTQFEYTVIRGGHLLQPVQI